MEGEACRLHRGGHVLTLEHISLYRDMWGSGIGPLKKTRSLCSGGHYNLCVHLSRTPVSGTPA